MRLVYLPLPSLPKPHPPRVRAKERPTHIPRRRGVPRSGKYTGFALQTLRAKRGVGKRHRRQAQTPGTA